MASAKQAQTAENTADEATNQVVDSANRPAGTSVGSTAPFPPGASRPG